MITLTSTQKQYLMDDDYRVEMEVNTVNEDDITITEADLVQGSFSGNRFSCVGNTIEIGSANAAEISFTLRNDDGTFDDVVFEGAQVIVWLRRGTSSSYTLNLRLFTARVDEVRHAIDSIQLVLLDSMVKLDRTAANLTYNTPQGVVQQICSACGITYNSAKSSLVNGTVALATPTTENLSYRQVLMWIAQITGTCAFIDPEDKLVLGWYTEDDSIDDIDFIQKSNRFSSDLDENEIVVTGVSATVGETTYQSKDDSVDIDYLIAIEGNELISETNVTTILAGLFNRVNGFSYTPFSATTMNMCWLMPLDMTEFLDKDDNPHMVIITDWTFTPHSSLQLAGKGESATRKGYASNPPFTAQQARIIEKLKRDVENVDVDDRITAVLGLNDAINHGMMLHTTTIDGKEYRHNAALISDSTYICTANSGGFAWTNSGWNDGDPVWEYGISSDGSAVLEQLSAYAISADVVSTGILQSPNGYTSINLNTGDINIGNGKITYDEANDAFEINSAVVFEAAEQAAQEAVADLDLQGVSIKSQTVTYATSSSGTTVPSSGWQSSVPTVAQGNYLWTKTTITYTDGTTDTTVDTYTASRQGSDGQQGSPGAAGKGISSITTYYKASTSSTTAPTGTYSTTPSGAGFSASNPYLWSYTVTTYSDNTTDTSSKYVLGVWGKNGTNGNDGDDGKGISSIVTQYYLSTSNSTQSDGSWSETPAEYVANRYYWQRDKITWSDSSITYTTAVLTKGLNRALLDANEANAAIGVWCYQNDKTIIDGSKIFANSFIGQTAILDALLTNSAEITGVIDLKGSSTSLTPTTSEKDIIGAAFFGKTYSAASITEKVFINLYSTVIKNSFQSKLRVLTEIEGSQFSTSWPATPTTYRSQVSSPTFEQTGANNGVFIPSTSGEYTFYTQGSYDTYGYLYNSSKTVIAYDDDSGDNQNFKITAQLTAYEIYYVGVQFYSSGIGNSVTVYVTGPSAQSEYIPNVFLTPLGMVVGNGVDGLDDDNIISQIFSQKQAGWYGANAWIPGDLYVGGQKITPGGGGRKATGTVTISIGSDGVGDPVAISYSGFSTAPYIILSPRDVCQTTVYNISSSGAYINAESNGRLFKNISVTIAWIAIEV